MPPVLKFQVSLALRRRNEAAECHIDALDLEYTCIYFVSSHNATVELLQPVLKTASLPDATLSSRLLQWLLILQPIVHVSNVSPTCLQKILTWLVSDASALVFLPLCFISDDLL